MRGLPIILCGIDEAGRGPLAGHLVVAGVILHSEVAGLNDSKKLTESSRRKLFAQIVSNSTYHYRAFTPIDVDVTGISRCIQSALEEIRSQLNATKYLFDGNSTFGADGIDTLVKADTQVLEVMAASIVAKTVRDDLLMAEAANYPDFSFSSHKGYGTAKHIAEIREYGLTKLHRKTFCKNFSES